MIYHITTRKRWEEALAKGSYEPQSLKEEGFIHASHEEQIPGVLERYYAGQNGLIKLIIDPEKLSSPLIFEWSPSTQDTFPHIYGPINIEAVIDTREP